MSGSGLTEFQLEAAAAGRGRTVVQVQSTESFVRLRLRGEGELVVDLAIDSSAGPPSVASVAGPTFDPEELAGRKLLALFGRVEARDFADDELPVDRGAVADLRRFCDEWADEFG